MQLFELWSVAAIRLVLSSQSHIMHLTQPQDKNPSTPALPSFALFIILVMKWYAAIEMRTDNYFGGLSFSNSGECQVSYIVLWRMMFVSGFLVTAGVCLLLEDSH